MEKGVTSNPLVQHAVEVHGGKKPHYLAVINRVESRPLYRAVREAVQISQNPDGVSNLNRCMEWRTPRVPVLSAAGGDPESGPVSEMTNPRPDWSRGVMDQIKEGKLKHIKYWTDNETNETTSPGETLDPQDCQGPPKKPTMDPARDDLDRESVSAVDTGGGETGLPGSLGVPEGPEGTVLEEPRVDTAGEDLKRDVDVIVDTGGGESEDASSSGIKAGGTTPWGGGESPVKDPQGEDASYRSLKAGGTTPWKGESPVKDPQGGDGGQEMNRNELVDIRLPVVLDAGEDIEEPALEMTRTVWMLDLGA